MEILIIGGTRYFGIHLVQSLLNSEHRVTIATRGITKDQFGDRINRIIIDRANSEMIKERLSNQVYDLVYDNLAYSSNDVKRLLDNISIKRYIMTSSESVYNNKIGTLESDFDPLNYKLIWCDRGEYSYSETKRQAECALFKIYDNQNTVAVRYPIVLGEDDYTKRLLFYVEHIIKKIPMNIDNLENQIAFISSEEAGQFLSYLANIEYTGPINGSSYGKISIRRIVEYIEEKTNEKAMIRLDGDMAPFNGLRDYSLNLDRAEKIGYKFLNLDDWIYELLNKYIEKVIIKNINKSI